MYAYARGFRAHASSPEKILKILCILVRFGVYFDQTVSRKIPKKLAYFIKKKQVTVTILCKI